MAKKLFCFFLLVCLLAAFACRIKKIDLGRGPEPVTVVVLGSSTAAGTGPREIGNAWVNRYLAYAESLDADNQVINLAKGGYTTYHLMPRDHLSPEGRPQPDPCRCITMALHLNPDAIVINLPSNDAAYGYSEEEQLANYDSLLALASRREIPVWITTTQPRNLTVQGRANLMAVRDSTLPGLGTGPSTSGPAWPWRTAASIRFMTAGMVSISTTGRIGSCFSGWLRPAC